MIHADEIYSVPQMAKILHIRPRTLYKMVSKKQIPFFRTIEGSQIRFAGWQVKNWIDERQKTCEQE